MEPRPPAGLLEEVVELARRFGSDPEFARGGGGNVSAKADGVLWIKPSGVSLVALTPDALMPLDMAPLVAMLASGEEGPPGSDPVLRVGMAARLRATDGRRPSVECLFHALLPDPIVVHTHPTTVNALACAVGGRDAARELFGEAALWIPYTDPGLPLARLIADERGAFDAATGRTVPRVLLLQSHGLIVTGSTASEIARRSDAIVAAVRERIGGAVPGGDGAERSDRRHGDRAASAVEVGPAAADAVAAALADLLSSEGRRKAVVHDGSALSAWVAGTPDGHAFVRAGPLTPDQIVYAGSWPLLLPAPPDEPHATLRQALDDHEQATGEQPSIVVVAGLGVFAAGDSPGLAKTALDVYLDAARISLGARRFGGARPMTGAERRFIEEWEAEAYRRGIAAATGDAP